MEQPFNDAAMLHFVRDSLFRSDSPLHHQFASSLERFIAERIASRESEWFPCISRDPHSLLQKLADTQAKAGLASHKRRRSVQKILKPRSSNWNNAWMRCRH